MYILQITFADHDNNGFATCGGAGFTTKKEWDQQWAAIPESPLKEKDPAQLILDKKHPKKGNVAEKFITKETAETLLDMPYDEMIEKGRERTPYTVGELKEMIPGIEEMAKSQNPKLVTQ